MSTIPSAPHFAHIESYSEFQNELNSLRSELEALVKAHKAGEAIFDIITKLMPLVEKYNLDYVQGNIANGQEAASYALRMSNYIEAQYKKYSAGDSSTAGIGPAQNALKAIKQLQAEIKANPKIFGSMGKSVFTQLLTTVGGVISHGEVELPNAQGLEKYWENSWTINSIHSKENTGTNTSGPILQAFSAAQNQAQSEAAFLQAKAKMANENYQKYDASQHDVESNFINVEKAAVTAAQSAGN